MDHQKRVDKCITKSLEWVPAGFGLGVVLSFVFFKKQSWPILLSTGFAGGMAVTNCEYEIHQKEYLVPCEKKPDNAKGKEDKKKPEDVKADDKAKDKKPADLKNDKPKEKGQ